ncbi:LOW QUALITY PROTEIN: uncharacterized protein ACIGJ3_010787, partial [Trichechus inunguis]
FWPVSFPHHQISLFFPSSGRDCPLLQVLAGEAVGEEIEGSLAWIVSWLLGGNNYSGLLLRLDPQGSSLSLLQAALLGASRRRMEVEQVKPTLWDAVEEAWNCQTDLRTLCSGLLGGTLTDSGLSQLGRALREPQVRKDSTGHLSWPWKEGEGRLHGGRRAASLGCGCHQKHPLRNSDEQTDSTKALQAPDVALQFFLAQARRQRLEQHQTQIREELKHLEQEEEEVRGDQVKGLMAGKPPRRSRDGTESRVLKLQLEGLQAEWDAAEQDLVALYDLHVQATRAWTSHVLQVFQAWRRLWEKQAMTAEHHHRSLLAGVLQDTISLATQNQELQVQNQQLHQGADQMGAVMLGPCPGEKSGDQESLMGSSLSPHS